MVVHGTRKKNASVGGIKMFPFASLFLCFTLLFHPAPRAVRCCFRLFSASSFSFHNIDLHKNLYANSTLTVGTGVSSCRAGCDFFMCSLLRLLTPARIHGSISLTLKDHRGLTCSAPAATATSCFSSRSTRKCIKVSGKCSKKPSERGQASD